MKYVLVFLITLYQKLVSPWLPPSCRYTPSCSQYAREALLKHGLFRGLLLAAKRLARCHPFHAGGYDPVP
jgi:putative membrane protein insertion efficiency factor